MSAPEIRRSAQEDLKFQLEDILSSVAAGNFATARAQLAGAKLIIDGLERKLVNTSAGTLERLSRWAE